MLKKTSKIAVIAGGISSEREISLKSGNNVLEALKRLGYKNAFLFDYESMDSINELIKLKQSKKIDAAVLMTHGRYGEDGSMQGLLELLGIPYSGSRVNASAVCMDKLLTKKVLLGCGLPTLPCWYEELPKVLGHVEGDLPLVVEVEDESTEAVLSGPFIIKPRNEGSSVGIVKVDNFDDYESDDEFMEKHPHCLIEPFMRGIEVTASVIQVDAADVTLLQERLEAKGNGNPYMVLSEGDLVSLPLLELRTKNDFYDYDAKYTKGKTEFVLPAELSPELSREVHEIAIDAFKASECTGYARVDFIIAGPDSVYPGVQVLEVNTLPGMTELSDMPAQAIAAGLTYDELVNIILKSVR